MSDNTLSKKPKRIRFPKTFRHTFDMTKDMDEFITHVACQNFEGNYSSAIRYLINLGREKYTKRFVGNTKSV